MTDWGMTTQDKNQPKRPQHREKYYKVQKLIERIETKLSLQSKTSAELLNSA